MRYDQLPKANANCVVCGAPYYRCRKCIELRDRGIYGWKLFCDGTQCYQVKITLDEYAEDKTKKAEIREAIDNIDFYPEKPEFISPYKELMEEVYAEEKPENNTRAKAKAYKPMMKTLEKE